MAFVAGENSYSILCVDTAVIRNTAYAFAESLEGSRNVINTICRKADEIKAENLISNGPANIEKDLTDCRNYIDNLFNNVSILGSEIVTRYINAEEAILGIYIDPEDHDSDSGSEGRGEGSGSDSKGQGEGSDSDSKGQGEGSGSGSEGQGDGSGSGSEGQGDGSGSDSNTSEKSKSKWKWSDPVKFGNIAYKDANAFEKRIDRYGKVCLFSKVYDNYESNTNHVGAVKVTMNLGTVGLGYNTNLKDKVTSKQKISDNEIERTSIFGKETVKTTGDKFGSIQSPIAEFGLNIGVTASVLKFNNTLNKSWVRGTGEFHVLEGTATASAGIGAYRYKDADGNETVFYGGRAAAGASVSVVGVSGDIDVGCALLGAGCKGSLDILKAEANGKLECGYVKGRGFNLNVGGNLEADLVKVTGAAYGRLAGVEVGASASLKVGVGIGGNFGIDNGKFKIGGSIALGVGFDFNITIDFSKVGTAIKEVYELVSGKVGAAVSAVGNGLKTAATTIGEGVCKVGSAIGGFFKSIF